MYSFLLGGKGILVLRTDNIDEASRIIRAKGFKTIDDDGLRKMITGL